MKLTALNLKRDFTIFENHPDLVYLDAVSTSLMPRPVVQAVSAFLENTAVSSRRGAYSLAIKGAELVEHTRKNLAQVLHTAPSQISFHGTTVDATASIVYGYDWKGNNRDTIVVSATDEHDTLVSAVHAAHILGLDVRVGHIDETGTLDIEQMADIIDNRVGIVIANTTTVGIGSVNPVLEISKLAHEVEAIFLSDASRSIGVTERPLDQIGADVILFSANVVYLAPPGLTIQWIDSSLGGLFKPGIIGNNAVTRVNEDSFELALAPDKFESGTLNVPAIVGLDAALDYLKAIGFDHLTHHLQIISTKLWEGLAGIPGIITYGVNYNGRTIFGFNIGSENPLNCHDVALFLDQSHIAVRSGFLCAHPLIQSLADDGIVQASLHIYNTLDDISRLLDALHSIVSML